MKLTTLDEDLRVHQKLDDEPNDVGGLSAQALKEKFDQAGLVIQKYLNETHLPEEEAAVAQALETAKTYTDQKVVAMGSGDMAVAVYDTKKRATDVYEYADAKAKEAKADTSHLGYMCCGTSTLSITNQTKTLERPLDLVDPRGVWPEGEEAAVAPAGAKAVLIVLRIMWARQTFANCYIRLKVNGEARTTRNGPVTNNGNYQCETVQLMAAVEEGDAVTVEVEAKMGTSTSFVNAGIKVLDALVEFIV